MKVIRCLILIVAMLCVAAGPGRAKELDSGGISKLVAEVLAENHYSRHPLDSELSRRFLDDYLDILDGDHLFLTRADVDGIVLAHGGTFASEIKEGRIDGAWSVYDLYRERAGERLKKNASFLKETTFDFKSDRTTEFDRAHAPWPVDAAEADRLWQVQLESEVLDEKLSGTTAADGVQKVRERYEQMRKELDQQTRKDALALVLSALAHAFDPHSDYLTKTDLEDLDSDMRLSMVGVGVVLQSEGRYVKVVSLLPGGPAAANGRLKVNDRIVAVAHGNEKFVDVVGMSFDRVLDLLRAKEGTLVRLKVISSRGPDLSQRREVDLVTRKIALTEEEAKGEVIEREPSGGGAPERLGWITLPSFYGDPDHPEDRSASRDVRSLVTRLKRQKISGLVIDLRDNPGGELEEAVELGGLFLGPVPIVQEKDNHGKIYISKACSKKIYDGPLVLLTNHLTASAAELFASALKDYRRAVIVGGTCSTYGKGSIQTVVELSDFLPRGMRREARSLGALDLTIGKFYRVSGSSTQLRGLDPDLCLPSPEDLEDEGEPSLNHPLPYDETEPLPIGLEAANLPIPQLRELSGKRILADAEFGYLREDLEKAGENLKANRLSLNESVRRAEIEDQKKRRKERETARSLQKPPAEKIARFSPDGTKRMEKPDPQKRPVTARNAGDSDVEKPAHPDVVRGETLNILSDLIRLGGVN